MNGSRRALLGIVAAGLLAAAGTAQAQTVGTTVTGKIDVSGKQVPLPPGEFTVVAVDTVPARLKKSGAFSDRLDYGPIRAVSLAQVKNGRVAAVVEIAANMIPYHDGWGTAPDCMRKDLYAAVTRYKSGWDVSCLYVKPLSLSGEEPAPGGEAVAGFARGANAATTDLWIVAGLRVADRQDVLDVRYNLDPAALGAPGSAGAADLWTPTGIESRPTQLTVVKDVAAWASGIAASLDRGLRGQLSADAFPAIQNAAATVPATDDHAAQSDALRQLRDAGGITDEEFQQQMAVIAASAAAAAASTGAGEWTNAQVAGWKAFTYRVVVTTINAGIDYVFIGRPFAAGVLVVLQVVVNTTKFFFHEMMWQELWGVSPLQRDGPNVMEFGRIVKASAS